MEWITQQPAPESSAQEKIQAQLLEDFSMKFLYAWKARGHLMYGSVGLVIALISWVIAFANINSLIGILLVFVGLFALIYGLVTVLHGLVGRRKIIRKGSHGEVSDR